MNKFDTLAQEWDANPIRKELSKNVIKEILKNVELNQQMNVLDYGTGTGLILLGIQPYISRITGMDNSQGMLDILKEKIKSAELTNVSLLQHNIEKDDLGTDLYDLVVSNMTLHHISNPNKFINKAFKSLKKGGILCITDLVTEDGTFHQPNDESVKYKGFDMEFIKSLIDKNKFKSNKIYSFYSINKTIDSGNKSYPVFIAVAIK